MTDDYIVINTQPLFGGVVLFAELKNFFPEKTPINI
jgi:hypothetical protein